MPAAQSSEILSLHAGPLSMEFDSELAFLRHVRIDEIEILRGVLAAVRDQDWNTIPYTVHDLRLEQSNDSFRLSWLARCAQDAVQFEWRGELSGTHSGSIRFQFQGQALGRFLRNRIGLCVLHPILECAGQACRIEHVDGSQTTGNFPKLIAPHQPFTHIRSISHRVRTGLEAQVAFEGETFEMEDQRNWTDASFKTYCTPLDLPFPVEVAAGTRIAQAVNLTLSGETTARASSTSKSGVAGTQCRTIVPIVPERLGQSLYALTRDERVAVQVDIDWQHSRHLPAIGFAMSTHADSPSEFAIDALRKLRPDHLRVDLRMRNNVWPAAAADAVALAEQLDARLEVALFAEQASGGEWEKWLQFFEARRDRVARWLVFHPTAKATPADLALAAYRALHDFDTSIPVVVGTDYYFAELNRNRTPVLDSRLVCYSINPQVHAFDKLSLRETLGAQRDTVDTAQSIFGGGVVISPITLRPRFNPNATSDAGSRVDAPPEPETDARQASDFAAAWTAGAVAQLAAHAGVASLTCYETFGPRGIMDAVGEPFPVGAVFAALRRFDAIHPSNSSQPLDIAAIALSRAGRERGLLLANMDNRRHVVSVALPGSRRLQISLEAEALKVLENEELR